MSNHEKENLYDVIILGTGTNGKDAVAMMQEQGKKALLINLDPEVIHSLIQQTMQKSSHPETSDLLQIAVNQHTFQTETHETNTFYFQAQPIPEIEVQADPSNQTVEEEIDTVLEVVHDDANEDVANDASDKVTSNQVEETVEAPVSEVVRDIMEEIVEEIKPKFDDEIEQAAEETVAKADQLIGEKDNGEKDTIHEEMDVLEETPEDTAIEINDAIEETKTGGYSSENSSLSVDYCELETDNDENKNSTEESVDEKPIHVEEVHEIHSTSYASEYANLEETTTYSENKQRSLQAKIRQQAKRLYQDSILSEHFFEGDFEVTQEAEELPYHSEGLDDTIMEQENESTPPPVFLEREFRLRKKNSLYEQISEGMDKPFIQPKYKKGKLLPITSQMEGDPFEDSEILNLENFTPRRRSRAQKKQKLFQKIEQIKQKSFVSHEIEPTSSKEDRFSTLLRNSLIHNSIPDNHPEEEEQDSHYEQNTVPPTKSYEPSYEEFEEEVVQPSQPQPSPHIGLNTLKSDTIEFEDPYDGYSSWEEVFPDTNSRKREEMDTVEKRKIALRGLHSLINNLG